MKTWNEEYCYRAKSKIEAAGTPILIGASLLGILAGVITLIYKFVLFVGYATPGQWWDQLLPFCLIGGIALIAVTVMCVVPWLWFHFCCAIGYLMFLREKGKNNE